MWMMELGLLLCGVVSSISDAVGRKSTCVSFGTGIVVKSNGGADASGQDRAASDIEEG